MKVLLKSGKDELPDREVTDATAVRNIGGNYIVMEFGEERQERISLFDYDVEVES